MLVHLGSSPLARILRTTRYQPLPKANIQNDTKARIRYLRWINVILATDMVTPTEKGGPTIQNVSDLMKPSLIINYMDELAWCFLWWCYKFCLLARLSLKELESFISYPFNVTCWPDPGHWHGFSLLGCYCCHLSHLTLLLSIIFNGNKNNILHLSWRLCISLLLMLLQLSMSTFHQSLQES